MRPLLLVVVVVGMLGLPGGGDAAPASDAPDSTGVLAPRRVVRTDAELPFRPSPGGAFRRSLLVPGWGQAYNRRPVKAILFAMGRGYLAWRAYDEQQQADDLRDEARDIADDEAARGRKERERVRALNRRDDFLWWSLYALFFTATEAYVDAFLIEFDEEFEGVREVTPEGETIRMGLRFRF